MPDDDDEYLHELYDDERLLMLSALEQWRGSEKGLRYVAPLVGAATISEFLEVRTRLHQAIERDVPLNGLDWTRALVLTEIAWGGAILGIGSASSIDMDDDRAVTALRTLQRELIFSGRTDVLMNESLLPPLGSLAPLRSSSAPMPERFSLDLSDDERDVLRHGVTAYSGPAKVTTFVATLVNANTATEVYDLGERVYGAVTNGEPLTDLDWIRGLALAEIAWASDVLGAGVEFGMTSVGEERALPAVRSLQRRLVTDERIQLLIDNALPLA